jgi:hypothetical protein
MKITGTRSYIIVELEDRKIRIPGELTTTPAFYASKDSIKAWEPPYEKEILTQEQKESLIAKILEENNKENQLKIYFF